LEKAPDAGASGAVDWMALRSEPGVGRLAGCGQASFAGHPVYLGVQFVEGDTSHFRALRGFQYENDICEKRKRVCSFVE
jgi:hypothetical protein